MCYFNQIRWSCGYWKWGRFHEQCNREYRIGETCGLMLVYETKQEPSACTLCRQIQIKHRRYDKMWRDVCRWQQEGGKPATIERTSEEMRVILVQLSQMTKEHNNRLQSLSLGRNYEPVMTWTKPAIRRPQSAKRKGKGNEKEKEKEKETATETEKIIPPSITVPPLAPLSSPSSSPVSSSSSPTSSSSSLSPLTPSPSPSSRDFAPVFDYDLSAVAKAAVVCKSEEEGL